MPCVVANKLVVLAVTVVVVTAAVVISLQHLKTVAAGLIPETCSNRVVANSSKLCITCIALSTYGSFTSIV